MSEYEKIFLAIVKEIMDRDDLEEASKVRIIRRVILQLNIV